MSVMSITLDLAAREKAHDNRLAVCLLISSLEFGGAERQVVEMFRAFDRNRVRPIICSLSDEVPLADSLAKDRDGLHIIRKRSRFDFTTVFRVARLLRREKIDVVHAFLFDAELVARLAAPLAGVPVVIASERNADYARPRLHEVLLRLTQPLFTAMVANSFAGKNFTVRTLKLEESRLEVVHNGVDTERFQPDRQAGLAFRQRHGVPADADVVGMVASFKKQKGHRIFLRMAAEVRKRRPDAWFLIVGGVLRDDLEASLACQREAKEAAAALGLNDRCLFLGSEKEVTAVYNACDVTVLLSLREGTPNVILESMACGVPVIASDVADNSLLVLEGKTGYIVPVEDHAAAAARVLQLLAEPQKLSRMGTAARERAGAHFSLGLASRKLENIYRDRLARQRPGAATR